MGIKNSKEWAYYLILFILTLLFFHKIVINPGQILYGFDAISSNLFHEGVIRASLSDFGQFPLWTNFHFSGVPFIGNPVIQIFYPLYILSLLFPENLFINCLFVVHVFLAGAFTFLFARKIGLGKNPSLISALTFMFSAVVVGKVLPGHLGSIIVISLMPLMFYLLERLISQPELKNALFFGLAWYLQMAGGMLQIFFYSSLALAIYLLVRLISIYKEDRQLKEIWKIISFLSVGLITCLLIGASFLLPTALLSAESGRTGGLDFTSATHMSLDPKQMITLLVPNFFGSAVDNTYWGSWENAWASYMYVGILPLLLALFGLIWAKERRKWIIFLIGLISLLFSMGRFTPFFRLAYTLIPGIAMFRVPEDALFLFCFALSLLAGYGVKALLYKTEEKKDAKKPILVFLTLITICVIILSSLIFFGKGQILGYGKAIAESRYSLLHPDGTDFEERYVPKLEMAYGHISSGMLWLSLLCMLSLLIFALSARQALSKGLLAFLIALVIIIDLWAFSQPLVDTLSKEQIYPDTVLFQFLKGDSSRYRVLDLSGYIPQQVLPKYRIESITGYDPLVLKDYILLTDLVADTSENYTIERNILTNIPLEYANISSISNTKILDLLNVKYIISREQASIAGFELVLEDENYILEREFDVFKYYSNDTLPLYVYENKNVLPRVFVVGRAKLEPDRTKLLGEMATPSFDPASYALIEKGVAPPNLLPLLEGEAYAQDAQVAGTAQISYYSPNKIIVEADMEKPGLLFLSELWQPGWKAIDNGTSTEVYRANYIFRAIYLSPGYHQIEMEYDSIPFKVGLFISIGAIALVLASLAYLIFSKKRQ